MFRKIKSFFSKKQKQEEKEEIILSAITIYTNKEFDVMVDVQLHDDSEECVDHLSSILTMFNPTNFFKVSSVIREQCKKNNEDELYTKIIAETVGKIGTSKFLEDYSEEDKEKPCVNPSDMI